MNELKLSTAQRSLFESFSAVNDGSTFSRVDMLNHAESMGMTRSIGSALVKKLQRVGRGQYSLDMANVVSMPIAKPVSEPPQAKPRMVMSTSSEEIYIPSKETTFVKWGYFKDVLQIIKSGMFYPMYVSGLSGNGKTMMCEQACAYANREFVRVQITPETDEDDLIGGFRLIDGETVFAKGPVIKAMEAGAVLVIDEIDRGSNKLMCLQGVLEGKPVLIKKTGEVISPAQGFNVIATANTKGQGDRKSVVRERV